MSLWPGPVQGQSFALILEQQQRWWWWGDQYSKRGTRPARWQGGNALPGAQPETAVFGISERPLPLGRLLLSTGGERPVSGGAWVQGCAGQLSRHSGASDPPESTCQVRTHLASLHTDLVSVLRNITRGEFKPGTQRCSKKYKK